MTPSSNGQIYRFPDSNHYVNNEYNVGRRYFYIRAVTRILFTIETLAYSHEKLFSALW